MIRGRKMRNSFFLSLSLALSFSLQNIKKEELEEDEEEEEEEEEKEEGEEGE